MILSTRGRYAVMAIVAIASSSASSEGRAVGLKSISESQNIPLRYLEQIFNKLKGHGIVLSVRGPGGGYIINGDINQISIADIIDAAEENIKMTRCSREGKCMPDRSRCKTHNLWKGLSHQIRSYLSSISLADATKENFMELI